MKTTKELELSNVKIGYRNFSGNEGPYNQEGERSFSIFLDEDTAREVFDDGWNVKWPKPNPNIKEEEDRRLPYLSVSVRFDKIPPKVVLIVGDKITKLDEEGVKTLDYAEIDNVDVIVTPSHWSVNGKTGIKAYLRSIYVTLREDRFTEKYGI